MGHVGVCHCRGQEPPGRRDHRVMVVLLCRHPGPVFFLSRTNAYRSQEAPPSRRYLTPHSSSKCGAALSAQNAGSVRWPATRCTHIPLRSALRSVDRTGALLPRRRWDPNSFVQSCAGTFAFGEIVDPSSKKFEILTEHERHSDSVCTPTSGRARQRGPDFKHIGMSISNATMTSDK